jgi:hypothetical protein
MLTRAKGTAASTPDTGVEDMYRELAGHRAAQARAALCAAPRRVAAFAQSAAALEDAAGALFLAAATGAGPDGTAAHELEAQGDALVSAAAHFEAAADRARGIAREPS